MNRILNREFDRSWTLFLDRDGVINEEILGSYVTKWDDFNFCENALSGIKILNEIFGTILIATNQRGVGKDIMSLDDLRNLHSQMVDEIKSNGGNIHRIYSAIAIEDEDHNRKPNIGMALQAKQDFPEIDFRKCIMVGNSLSDMEFGKRAGMHTVFVTTKIEPFDLPHPLIDEQFSSLFDWAQSLVGAPISS